MNGLKRNVAKLMGPDGKLFVMAMDHAQGGQVPGLEQPYALLSARAQTELDGFLVNVGIAPYMAQPALLHKKLLLRTSFGGSSLNSAFSNLHANHVSPETALRLGADAVVMMFVMGQGDAEPIQEAARDIDAFHQYGIPVVAEILSTDMSLLQTDRVQGTGARVAAELGADVVKAFYTPNFGDVIAQCPVPVILAGGPKGADIEDVAREAVKCGVAGFAFGRNLFQGEGIGALIQRLSAILRA